jgi:hypothetical protein
MPAWDVAISGGVAYVVSTNLTTVDYSDPASPAPADSCCEFSPVNTGFQVAVHDDRAIVAEQDFMRNVDATDPGDLFAGPNVSRFNHPSAIAVSGDMALVSQTSLAARLLSLSGDAPLAGTGSVEFTDGAGLGSEDKIDFDGSRALIARGAAASLTTRLYGLLVSDPSGVVIAGMREFDGVIGALALQGDVALVATDAANGAPPTLWCLDASDLSLNLPTISSLPTPVIVDVETLGDVLYALSAEGDLHLYDIANPAAPSPGPIVGGVVTPGGEPVDIEIADDRAYIIDREAHITTLDLANPMSPQCLANAVGGEPDAYAADCEVAGRSLYMAGGFEGGPKVIALDMSNPTAPMTLAEQLIPPYTNFPLALAPNGLLVGGGLLIRLDFVSCPCLGDANGDNVIDFDDLNVVLAAFNTSTGDPDFDATADFDADGDVDFADLNVLVSAFNTPC